MGPGPSRPAPWGARGISAWGGYRRRPVKRLDFIVEPLFEPAARKKRPRWWCSSERARAGSGACEASRGAAVDGTPTRVHVSVRVRLSRTRRRRRAFRGARRPLSSAGGVGVGSDARLAVWRIPTVARGGVRVRPRPRRRGRARPPRPRRPACARLNAQERLHRDVGAPRGPRGVGGLRRRRRRRRRRGLGQNPRHARRARGWPRPGPRPAHRGGPVRAHRRQARAGRRRGDARGGDGGGGVRRARESSRPRRRRRRRLRDLRLRALRTLRRRLLPRAPPPHPRERGGAKGPEHAREGARGDQNRRSSGCRLGRRAKKNRIRRRRRTRGSAREPKPRRPRDRRARAPSLAAAPVASTLHLVEIAASTHGRHESWRARAPARRTPR